MLTILFPNCTIEGFEATQNKLILQAHSETKAAACPVCNERSGSVHGYYQRHPYDLPLVNYQLQFCLRVKRFTCLNSSCKRRTFAESFEPWLARYAQRSRRLTERQSCVSTVLSAKASEALLANLQMTLSHDTALNLVKAQVIRPPETVRVLGVDDCSIRKRKHYGTILVDLEKHEVIDVLADRTSETLTSWLKEKPDIEIISRDRSQEYKTACDEGAPQALQVADRWHLHKNLGDSLKRWFERHKKHLTEPVSESEALAEREDLKLDPQNSFEKIIQAKLDNRQRRLALFAEAKRLRAEGFSLPTIAHELKMGRSTLSRWFSKHGFPDAQKKRKPEPYMPYLKQRFEAGIRNKMQLYREIVSQGFEGSYGPVYLYFTELAAGLDPMTRPEAAKKQAVKRISAFEATRLFTKAAQDLNEQEQQRLERFFTRLKEAKPCYELVQRFTALFKMQDQAAEQTIQTFTLWLKDSLNSGISELVRFAKGLSNDKAAIEAALTLPWSNGQTEGKITKLKLIKRTMYGRANFELLRQKVLLAA